MTKGEEAAKHLLGILFGLVQELVDFCITSDLDLSLISAFSETS
jgi:hypothetical protein